jgi:hypothetical protein
LLAVQHDPAPDDHALAHEAAPRIEDGADAGAGDRGLEVIHGEVACCWETTAWGAMFL